MKIDDIKTGETYAGNAGSSARGYAPHELLVLGPAQSREVPVRDYLGRATKGTKRQRMVPVAWRYRRADGAEEPWTGAWVTGINFKETMAARNTAIEMAADRRRHEEEYRARQGAIRDRIADRVNDRLTEAGKRSVYFSRFDTKVTLTMEQLEALLGEED